VKTRVERSWWAAKKFTKKILEGPGCSCSGHSFIEPRALQAGFVGASKKEKKEKRPDRELKISPKSYVSQTRVQGWTRGVQFLEGFQLMSSRGRGGELSAHSQITFLMRAEART